MNNKLIRIAVVAFAIITSACSNSSEDKKSPSFSIEAKIDALKFKTAYLNSYSDGEFLKIDSSVIEQGQFSFKGNVQFPEVYYISFDGGEEKISLFVENSNITITGTNLGKDNITISGSEINTQMEAFNEKVGEYEEKLKAITGKYYALENKEDTDTAAMNALGAQYELEDSLKKIFIEEYIQSNSNSVIAPYLSLRYMMNGDNVEEMEALKNSFGESIKASKYVSLVEERISIAKSSAVGQIAPMFEMSDKDGNPVSLESFKGKYVLVDFWASWCGPCRRENPNVVAAYNKYHEQGFDVFGVSFDTNKEQWLGAVEKDNLTWTHVSDLKGWGNAAGKLYGVRSIPFSVLLDKEGVIIAKNLREEKLHEKLAEIFNAES